MIVLFLSFVLSVILVKSELVLINDTQLKNQLQKSLTHVNDMLAEIEGQIESERKEISQVDYDLNYEDTPPGFLDYEVTDIWWPANISLNVPSSFTQGGSIFTQRSVIPAATTPKIVATTTFIPTINTTETQTQETFSPGVPQHWPFQNTPHPGTSEFVQELQNAMEKDKFGYFTVGLTKFLELVAIKDPQNITPILNGMEAAISNVLKDHIQVYFGNSLQINLGLLFDTMKSLLPTKLQKKAGVGHYILKNKYFLASTDVNACLELYDSMFQPNEGLAFFGSLEEFHKYPDGGQKATEVGRDMLNVALMPFKRSNSTEDQSTLVSCSNEAILALNSYLRMEKNENNNYTSTVISNAKNMLSSVLTNETSVQSSNVTGVPLSGLPSRRRMGHDSKKLMRHFLTKHRKLFKRLNKHHKYNKRKKHDHLHHKIHHHTYHRKHKKHQNKHREQRDHDDQHDPHDSHDQYNSHNQDDSHDQHNSHNQHDSQDQHNSHNQDDSHDQHNSHNQDDSHDQHNSHNQHDSQDQHNSHNQDDSHDQHNSHNQHDSQDQHNSHNQDDSHDQHNSHNQHDSQDQYNSHNQHDSQDQHNSHNQDDSHDQHNSHNQHDSQDQYNSHNQDDSHDQHNSHNQHDSQDQYNSHNQDDSHDQHNSHNQPDSHDQHNSHDSHDQHEQYVQYEHHEKPYRKMGEESLVIRAEEDKEASGSQAYFQAPKKKKKSIRKVRNLTQYHIETPPKRKLLGNIDKQYSIELANKFKVKMNNENYGRFNSLEKESNEKSEGSKNNRVLHEIREDSSYSDEGYYLKTKLYDALRHGNRIFAQFHNDTIPGLSSDEELMIKNNLYKVF